MKDRSIVIAGETFKSRTAAGDKARGILNKYPVGAALDATDKAFILGLLELHPSKEIKVGCGIASISIMNPQAFTNCRCFKLTRSDGSWTDFSFRKCLEKISPARYAKAAARHEVREQTEYFKAHAFTGRCAITNEPITLSDAHVDHVPPATFDVLFADFLSSRRIRIEAVATAGVGDCQIGRIFVDRELAAAWCEYHRKHAKLRIVSAHANLNLVPRLRGAYA